MRSLEGSGSAGLVRGRRAVIDDRGAPARAADAAPARPEHHRQHEPDGSDHDQDVADRVDVQTVDGRVDRKRENRAGCNQDQTDSDTHVQNLLACVSRQRAEPAVRYLNGGRLISVTARVPAGSESTRLAPGAQGLSHSTHRDRAGRRCDLHRGGARDPLAAARRGPGSRTHPLRLLVRHGDLHRRLLGRGRGARLLGLEVPRRAR